MNKPVPELYRPCVGIMLVNQEGKVFTGQRIDKLGDYWQMPQGGIDEGETVEEATFRELYEETGISKEKVEIIAIDSAWRKYDLPSQIRGKLWGGKYKGQIQKWVLLGFLGEDSDVRLDVHKPEFSTWQWQNIVMLPHVIVPFKQDIYTQVLKEFRPLVAEYLANI